VDDVDNWDDVNEEKNGIRKWIWSNGGRGGQRIGKWKTRWGGDKPQEGVEGYLHRRIILDEPLYSVLLKMLLKMSEEKKMR
jgi:hypothetical protein